MKLTRDRRKAVWDMFGGRCAYCGIALVSTKWHVDHVEPVIYDLIYAKGGYADGRYSPSRMVKNGKMLHPERDVIENLFPACPVCNINKGSEHLKTGAEFRGIGANNLRKYNANFRHAERFGRVVEVSEPIVFWFEKWNATHQVA